MTLLEDFPLIKAHLEHYWNQLVHEKRLHDIYEGQLQPYVDQSIDLEYTKPETRARVKQRIPYINMLTRVVDKMSKVYVEGCDRVTANETDQLLVEYYEDCLRLNVAGGEANKMLNLNRRCALEPYLDNRGYPRIRIIPAHLFSVWSGDDACPTEPTVFIKFVGVIRKKAGPYTNMQDGSIIHQAEYEYRNVGKFHLFSDDEFLVVDGDGDVLTEEMAQFGQGWSEGVNPLGRIPFVYVKDSEYQLIPLPASDMYSMAIQVPKLLADLMYAVQFQSHSIIYGIDVDINSMVATPDAAWEIKSDPSDGTKQPQIGVISPTVDIPNVLQLIQTTIGLWLEARNIRAGQVGNPTGDQAISGVAKMIDEMDTTQVRKEQIQLFKVVEQDLWDLVTKLHNLVWMNAANLPDECRVQFNQDFYIEMNFPDPQPFMTEKDRIDIVKEKMDLGLISKHQALSELYPDKDDEQIQAMLDAINEEKAQAVADAQAAMGVVNETNPAITVSQDNTGAAASNNQESAVPQSAGSSNSSGDTSSY